MITRKRYSKYKEVVQTEVAKWSGIRFLLRINDEKIGIEYQREQHVRPVKFDRAVC